jgi:hypothetical protein
MGKGHSRRALLAAAAITATAAGAAPAHAATVTVTGDDGNPVALAQGAPAQIRQMSPTVGIAFPPAPGRFSLAITGPDGAAVASPLTCFTNSSFTRSVEYRGNGAYTVGVANYASDDRTCARPVSTEVYTFAIGAGVALAQPAARFLIRAPNSFSRNTLNLPVAVNPGAGTHELRYAAGGVIGPDGAISGPSDTAFVNPTTGTAGLTFRDPGTYTAVARAARGQWFTPWSPPVRIQAVVPFDLQSVTFPDARGPSYRLRGTIREKAIRGRVNLAIARGTKRGKYRSLGSVRISSKGTFTKRFRQRRTGTYRLRVRYKGSSLAAGGTVVGRIRITRRVAFG